MTRFSTIAAERANNTYYSQDNEDHLLFRIFGGKPSGTAVEVGGFDGITYSNTYLFEKLGWRTLIIEPMPDYAAMIRKNRRAELFECAAGSCPGEATLTIAKGAESLSTLSPTGYQLKNMEHHAAGFEKITVPVRTLDEIFESAKIEVLDFITVDVEGHEKEALAGLKLPTWNPEIVIVEDPSMGAGSAVKEIMQAQGYSRFMTTGCNDWYAPRSNKQFINWKSRGLDSMRTLVCKILAMRDRFAQPSELRDLPRESS